MRVFMEGVRPVEGLLIDGLGWGLGVGAAVPLVIGVVGGALGGSPDSVVFGFIFGLAGAVVGTVSGGAIGLVAGLLFELWSFVRAPALVVALGTVAPVFVSLYAGSVWFDGDGGAGFGVASLAAGPLVADVLRRARRLEVERAATSPADTSTSRCNEVARRWAGS